MKGKWVYDIKRDGKSMIQRMKARYTAKGFTQIHGIDYDETFSPTTKFNSFRTMLAMAAKHKMTARMWDVSTAFLHAPIDEEVYVEQPQGHVVKGKEHYVYRLRKSLYGLKQSSRNFYTLLHDELIALGYEALPSDPCLFMRCDANGECVYLLTHVDDIAAFAKDENMLTHALNELKRKFAIRDDGKLTYYLGVNVDWHDNGDIYMHQTAYAERVCTRFAEHMHAKHTDTPHKPGPEVNHAPERT